MLWYKAWLESRTRFLSEPGPGICHVPAITKVWAISGPLAWAAKGCETSALLKVKTGVPFTGTDIFDSNGNPIRRPAS
jgi:hypothetical protein